MSRPFDASHDLVLDQSQHGVLIFQRGRLIYANLKASQMIGYSPERIGELSLGEILTIVHPSDRARLMDVLQTVLSGHFAPIQPEVRVLRRDGSQVWVDILVNPITYKDNPAILFNWIDISARRQAEESLRHSVRRLQILHEVEHAILSAQDEQATAQAALNNIHHLVPHYQGSSVLLIDLKAGEARLLALDLNQEEPLLHVGQTFTLEELSVDLDTLQFGKPFLVADLDTLPMLTPLQEGMRGLEIRSYLTVPLILGNELIGTLNLASDVPDAFKTEQKEIAQEIADSLAVAIQQARLRKAEHQRRQDAEVMRDVMAALANATDMNQALEVILVKLRDLIHYDRAGLFLLDENKHYVLAEMNQPADGRSLSTYAAKDPLVEELKGSHKPIAVSDIQVDSRFDTWPDMQSVHAWLGAPLFVGKELIGFLSIGSLEPGTYGEAEASVLEIFTSQVANVLERAWLHEQSNRRTEEFEVLSNLTIALDQTETRENALSAIIHQTSRVLNASACTFLALGADQATLTIKHSPDQASLGLQHLLRGDFLSQALQSGKPVTIPDTRAFKRSHPEPVYRAIMKNAYSALLIPLRSGDSTLGLLCFTFKKQRNFSAEDLHQYQVTEQIAGAYLRRAVELESLEKQVEVRTQHLNTLYNINTAASEPLDLYLILEKVLHITLDAMDSQTGAVHLLTPSGEGLRLVVQQGLPEAALPVLGVLEVTENFWRKLFSTSNPLIVADIQEDSRLPFATDLPGLLQERAYVGTPIKAKGQPFGLLSIFKRDIRDFNIEDITLLMTIADQIGFFVERARLIRKAELAAVVEERQRLARELHDSVTQLLYSQVLFAGAGKKALQQDNLPSIEEYLSRIDQAALQALKEMRLLVYELRPSDHLEEGLVSALQRRLDAVENRSGMDVQLSVDGSLQIDEMAEMTLYRITQEALNNTIKHSGARHVMIDIHAAPAQVLLSVEDDGCGFDVAEKMRTGGIGLSTMQERITALGGVLEIESSPGHGTRITATIGQNE